MQDIYFCICKTICFAQVYVFAYAKVYTLYKTYSFAYAKYTVLRRYMVLHAATMTNQETAERFDRNEFESAILKMMQYV